MTHESGRKAVNTIHPAGKGKLRSRMLTSAVIVTLGLAGFGAVAAGPALADAASPGAGGALTEVLPAPVGATGAEHADAPEADGKKIAFCHRTASETNPYVSLETSINAFYNSGHISHTGPVFPGVGPDGFWGDIFPPNEFSPAGQNWTEAGQGIFANGCNLPIVPTPTETTPAPEPTETTPAPEPTETTPAPEPTETTPAPEPTETTPVPTDTTQEPTETTPVTTTDATTPAAAPSASGTPSAAPATALAQTGANGPMVFGIGGAALMLVGAAALWRTRRVAGSH